MASIRQLNVVLFGFPYGGNSGVSNEQATVARWREQLAVEILKDDRIAAYHSVDLCDTPITMTRNRAVVLARQAKADVLVMIDSDMTPDVHCQPDQYFDPRAKPFFKTAFDFLYDHYDRGPVCLMAPYGGKQDHENMFVFRWRARSNDVHYEDEGFQLDQWTREECAAAAGIHDVAAGPTGLCMIDMRCFDLLEPKDRDDKPWFYYEYTDKYQQAKATTEDVAFTRDLSLLVNDLHGYEPNKVLFDCWAGHNGFRVTRRPQLLTSQDVAAKFRRAADRESKPTLDVKNLVKPVPKPQTSQADRMALRKTAEVLKDVQAMGGESALAAMRRFANMNHTQADMDALAKLCRAAKQGVEALVAAEIGSFIGESAKAIVDAVRGNCELYCIDTWKGSPSDSTGLVAGEVGHDRFYEAFCENCAAEIEGRSIIAKRGASLEQVKTFNDRALDLVFIDAEHTYEAVKADIEAWLPKVREGGILCGHDYGPLAQASGEELFPGVRKAVDEAFGDRVTHHTGTNIWSVVVTHTPTNNPPAVNRHRGNGAGVLVGATPTNRIPDSVILDPNDDD